MTRGVAPRCHCQEGHPAFRGTAIFLTGKWRLLRYARNHNIYPCKTKCIREGKCLVFTSGKRLTRYE